MVDPVGIGLGVLLVFLVVAVHVGRGTAWEPAEDIADAVLEHRAGTLTDTGLPAPSSRAVGGGATAGAVAGGDADAELEAGDEAAVEDEGPWSLSDDEAGTFSVEFVKEGETLEVRENQTVLEAGEEEGWDLPYACREGQCLSCGGRVTDGPSEDFLVHHGQEMLNEDELGDGYTLTCVAYPTADFSIETREAP